MQNVCFDFLYKFCPKNFSFWKQFSEKSQMYIVLHVKYPSFLPDFNATWISSTDFRKKKKKCPQMSNIKKPHPVGAELLHADGDTTNLTVVFRSFAKAPI